MRPTKDVLKRQVKLLELSNAALLGDNRRLRKLLATCRRLRKQDQAAFASWRNS